MPNETKIPMSDLVMPKFPMGLVELSIHLEEVAEKYKPLNQEDLEKTIEAYTELLDHESWVVVEGAIYGLELLYYKHGVPWSRIRSIIEDIQFSHPSKVIRTVVKCIIRFNDRSNQ